MKIFNILILICLAPFANNLLAQALACNPTADPDQICVGESSQLHANATGGSGNYTFSWLSIPPGFASNLESPVVNPNVTTTYSVTVSDGYDFVEGSTILTVNPTPVANAGDDQSIPYGAYTTLTGSASSGSGYYSFHWDPADMLVNPELPNPATVNMFSTTLFTLTVTDLVNGCQATDQMLLTVFGGPLNVSPIADPSSICRGESSQLSSYVSGGSGNYTYSWSSEPPGFSSDLANPIVMPISTTTYTVVVNDGYNIAEGNTTVTVHLSPVPNAGPDISIPYGTSTTLQGSASSGSGNYLFHWEPANKLVDPDNQYPTTVNITEATLFSLHVTDVQTGCLCEDPDDVVVTINGPLAVSPVASPGSICSGASSILYANASGGSGNYAYTWTSNPPGFTSYLPDPAVTPEFTTTYYITVYDGYNTVQGSVTVTVNLPPQIDETNLIITPSTCTGASGSITGLYALGSMPFTYKWEDLSGVEYGSNIDVSGLPAGQYVLTVTDGNGCETVSSVYTVGDAGDLQVTQITTTRPHCSWPDGEIVVHAFSPSGSVLEYSIDNGDSYQADSLFTGLVGASYVIRVADVNGCEGFYLDNPFDLIDITGPQVEQVNVTDETDYLGNGAIEIVANGSTPVIYYSIDNGNTWQTNNGSFNNLHAGIYTCVLQDEYDCDTTFVIEIQNIIFTFLKVSTGEGSFCLGNTALVPMNVENFHSVRKFHLKLSYNKDNLLCEGYTNANSQLIDSLTAWVDQAAGVIDLAWNSPIPITFTQTETIAELVFTTINSGQGLLAFYTGANESYFTDAGGNPIPAEFQTGQIIIYGPPEFNPQPQNEFLYFGNDALFSVGTTGDELKSYQWYGPSGLLENDTLSELSITSVSAGDAGNYYCTVTNACGSASSNSATLTAYNQLSASAGTDVAIMPGNSTVLSGSYTGGSPSLSILWTPDALLDDPNILNPQTLALYNSQAFTLTINDLLVGYQASDIVLVTVIEIDTLEYFGPEDDTLYQYSNRGNCGYISGNNCDLDKIKANYFTDEIKTYNIEKVLIRFGAAMKTSQDEVPVKIGIWAKSAGNDMPGNLIDFATVPLSQIVQDVIAERPTTAVFTAPVAVPNHYFVGVFLPQTAGDTVALMTNKDGGSEAGIAWTLNAANEWLSYSSDPRFFLRVANAIFPVVKQNNVGINEPVGTKGKYLIYPNPVNNILHICSLTNHAFQSEMFFYDLQGRMILYEQFTSTTSLDLQGIDPGIYMLIIREENRVENYKVIVY